jgi:predicted RNase H-like HicB family nuclease
MVEEAVKRYRVAYERDEAGWWVASVRGVRGCHTQGRTVDEARRRIREALELFVGDARKAPSWTTSGCRVRRRGRFEPTRRFERRPTQRTDAPLAQLDMRSGYSEPES